MLAFQTACSFLNTLRIRGIPAVRSGEQIKVRESENRLQNRWSLA